MLSVDRLEDQVRTEKSMRKIQNNNTSTPTNRFCMSNNMVELQKCQLLPQCSKDSHNCTDFDERVATKIFSDVANIPPKPDKLKIMPT